MNSTHIFTSYFSIGHIELDALYVDELLPIWYETNAEFVNDIHIYTNIPDVIKKRIPNIVTHYMEISDNINMIMSTQINVWTEHVGNLSENETAIYLDPDAFLLTDRLVKYAPYVNSHALTKKSEPFCASDAGVSILKNTAQTKVLLNELMATFTKYPNERTLIEFHYDKTYRGNSQYYIKWSKVNILLRNCLCGRRKNEIDVIHGTTNADTNSEILKIILKKEQLRIGVY